MTEWNSGIDEAIARLREHLSSPAPVKFDARDRAALAFVLDRARESVFAVVYSSYADDEVAGLYATRELAEAEAANLGGMWEVARWGIRTTVEPQGEP